MKPQPGSEAVRWNKAGGEVRDGDDGQPVLSGHFAVFNRTTVIDSFFEGKFRERIAPGAFAQTFGDAWASKRDHGRMGINVSYNHGFSQYGDSQLGGIRELREDGTGAYYEVPLIDVPVNRDYVIPAGREGLLGASFRFVVPSDGDEWDDDPDDGGLPIRTIHRIKMHGKDFRGEFGPVDYPAYEAATAGVRSRTDYQAWRTLTPEQRRDFIELLRVGANPELAPPGGAGRVAPPTEQHLPRAVLTVTEARALRARAERHLRGATHETGLVPSGTATR